MSLLLQLTFASCLFLVGSSAEAHNDDYSSVSNFDDHYQQGASHDLYNQPRFLFLFNPFQMQQSPTCQTLLSGSQVGICEDLLSCVFKGGKPLGHCNFGTKTCCVAKQDSFRIMSSFVKSDPNAMSGSLTVNRASNQFCQVKVDFNIFDLDAVDNDGLCMDGSYTVTGQADRNVPVLCGLNTGQTIYLNFDSTGTPITMNIVTSSVSSNWDIKTTQIACNDQLNLAPSGCLQYFPETIGTIQSFNYRPVTANNPPVTFQPANLNYRICIGSLSSSRNIVTYTPPSDGSTFFFTVSGDTTRAEMFLGQLAVADFDARCTRDYVGIAGGTFTNFASLIQTSDKFCGLGFPASVQVISAMRPFEVVVVTDAQELLSGGDMGNVGFSLTYTLS